MYKVYSDVLKDVIIDLKELQLLTNDTSYISLIDIRIEELENLIKVLE